MSETTHTAEVENTNKLDTSTLDLPSATIEYEAVIDGKHYIEVSFDIPHSEVPYIIGQFRGSEYKVIGVSFERNEIRFIKETYNE
ncbi:hypothetical protein OSG_eHP9_00040 [environmental Halophage eHP-9]|nr:hypothetical protein OSG_eHP9_00040 [environmental Halophage eHP-9]